MLYRRVSVRTFPFLLSVSVSKGRRKCTCSHFHSSLLFPSLRDTIHSSSSSSRSQWPPPLFSVLNQSVQYYEPLFLLSLSVCRCWPPLVCMCCNVGLCADTSSAVGGKAVWTTPHRILPSPPPLTFTYFFSHILILSFSFGKFSLPLYPLILGTHKPLCCV